MGTRLETIKRPLPGTERQRQAFPNAIARRRLERTRGERALHRFINRV